jgi:sugar lactone lactonase YvrE
MLWLVALFIVLQPGIFSKKVKLEDILLRAYLFVFIIFILQGKMVKEGFQTTSTYVVTTLAGSGNADFADGTGTAASFKYPSGIAVDTNGMIYIADRDNNRIRKMTPQGEVTTLAGSGFPRFFDGAPGSYAAFNLPIGIAIDRNGNIIVADYDNNAIRRVEPNGMLTTIAGQATADYLDGTGTNAKFKNPYDVAVDSNNNIYVAETERHRIRKITPEGVVTTFAGSGTGAFADGTGTGASFYQPYGLAVDSNNNVFVADFLNRRIRKITPEGVVTTFAGGRIDTYTDGTGTGASIAYISCITIDSNDNIFFADNSNTSGTAIRMATPQGVVITIAGSVLSEGGYVDGIGSNAKFNLALGIAVDANNNIIVADSLNHRIRMIKQSVKAPPVSPLATALTIPTNSLSPTSIGLIVGGSVITLSIILYVMSNSRKNTIFD